MRKILLAGAATTGLLVGMAGYAAAQTAPALPIAPLSGGLLCALRVPGQPLTGALIPFGSSAGIEAAIDAGSQPKEHIMFDTRTLRIRKLSAAFRQSLSSDRGYCTERVSARGAAFAAAAVAAVRAFDAFTSDNDPHGEHDLGAFTVDGAKVLWKVDHYDLSSHFGSNDPANPAQTTRLLIILLAEEY